MSKCGDIYKKAFGELGKAVSKGEWDQVEKLFGTFTDVLDQSGISRNVIRQLGDEKSMGAAAKALDEQLDQIIKREAKDLASSGIKKVQQQSSVVKNIDYHKTLTDKTPTVLKKTQAEKAGKALVDMLYTNSHGSASLESRINAEVRVSQNKFREGMEKIVGHKWINFLKTGANTDLVTREIFNIEHGIKSPDSPHRLMAQHIYDSLDKLRVVLNKIGGDYSFRKGSLPINFKWKEIKANKDNFISMLTEALDPKTHGDPIARSKLANDIFDAYDRNDGVVDLDRIGDVNGNPQFAPIIKYKDADSWIGMNNTFGSNDLPSTLMRSIDRYNKKIAIHQMWGPSPDKGFADFVKAVTSTPDGFTHPEMAKYKTEAEARFRRMTQTHIPEWQRVQRGLAIFRDINVGSKLGGTLLSSIGDPIMLAFAARQFYGLSAFKAVTAPFRLAGKDSLRRARATGAVMDGVERYFGTQFNDGFADRAGHLSSEVANMVMRMSGLEWWTGGVKAGAMNLHDEEFAKMIRSKTSWADMATENPRFRRNLEIAGIGENEWARMNKEEHIGDDGLFDMFRVPQTNAERDGLTHSLQNKLSAYYTTAVEGSILTPGMADTQFTTFGFEPGSLGHAVMKSLTQFLSFPITAHRRLLYRTLSDDMTSGMDKVVSMATFTTLMFGVNMLSTQMKEILKGNQPYAVTSPDFITKSMANQPWGIVVDMFMKLGGETLMNTIEGNKAPSLESKVDFLGPTLKTYYDLMEGAATGNISKIAKTTLQSVPGQNLWWSAAAYRYFVLDTVQEFIDPKKYREQKLQQLRDVKGRIDLSTGAPAQTNKNFIAKALTK